MADRPPHPYGDDRPTAWTPMSCFTLFLLIAAFWLVVIGGGFWLADRL